MTLKEQLDLFRGKEVKIGFKSQFVYCGICDENIENILNEVSEKEHNNLITLTNIYSYELENFDLLWKTRIEKTLNRIEAIKENKEKIANERYGRTLKKIKKKMKKKLKNAIDEKEIKTEKRKLMKEAKEKLTATLNSLKIKYDKEKWQYKLEIMQENRKQFLMKKTPIYVKRLKEFTPFLEREVKEVYNSILDKNTKIIRCKGHEIGGFWTKQEYDKAKLKEKNDRI